MAKKEKKSKLSLAELLKFEDDAVRSFKASRAGKELLNVQQSIFMSTGLYLPDNM